MKKQDLLTLPKNIWSMLVLQAPALVITILFITFQSTTFANSTHLPQRTQNICSEGNRKTGGKTSVYVSLGKQKMYICEGDKVVWYSWVFTGRRQYPTPNSDFKIMNKAKGVYFNCDPGQPAKWIIDGVRKCYYSKYWIGIGYYKNTGSTFGFHDADWWSYKQWQNRVYLNQSLGLGSHGCINIPRWEMSDIYRLIKVGDLVLIRQ